MNRYEMTKEEMDYLARYDIAQYERPSIAADMTVYSIMEDGKRDNFRKLPKQALKLLLIKRATFPYKDCWALPGGFCRPNEDVWETAKRELCEETSIEDAYLSLLGVFGEKGRDPRGWIISNTFLALVNGENYSLRTGTDAWEAKWFSLQVNMSVNKKKVERENVYVETMYEITLMHEETDTELTAEVKECKEFRNYHETSTLEVVKCNGIAFDHAKIILYSILSLRKNVEEESKVVFDLMPEMFTLTQLQNAFELILDQELLTANFRRKIAEYVIETEQIIEGAGHRPAKLFRRNVEKFYK